MDELDARTFLLYALRRDELLECEFRRLYGATDAESACRTLKKKLNALVKAHSRRGYINYEDAYPFGGEYLDAIDEAVRPFRERRDVAGMFAIADAVISHMRFIDIDDSDGFCSDVLAACGGIWNTAFNIMEDDSAVDERIGELRRLSDSLEVGKKRRGNFDEFIVGQIDDLLVKRFGEDPVHAGAILELADKRLASAQRDRERQLQEASRRGGGFQMPMNRSSYFDYEIFRWAAARVRALSALGTPSAEILAFARPYENDRNVLLALYDALSADGKADEGTSLLEEALTREELSSFDKRAIMLFLRDVYRDAGDTESLRSVLAHLIIDAGPHESSALTGLLDELRQTVPADQWAEVRDGVFLHMGNPEALCDCLAAEGLVDRLLAELASDRVKYRSPASYEELLRDGHADVLVKWYGDQADREMPGASNRKEYRRVVGYLTRLKGLPGGREVAEGLARLWRERFPRRTAMQDELRSAGF